MGTHTRIYFSIYMVKKFVGGCVFLVIIAFACMAMGIYPVAIVNGSPILARTWKQAEAAAIQFMQATMVSSGKAPIDFGQPENARILLQARKDALLALIENKLVAKEGDAVMNNFDMRAQERVESAVRESVNLKEGVALLYGLDFNAFRDLVLLPQARRDLLRETFEKKKQDFFRWFSALKTNARVRLLFTPFSWDGERVK